MTLCLHCETRPRMNGVGSLCDWCWRNVPNKHNSERHDGRSCKLRCREPKP